MTTKDFLGECNEFGLPLDEFSLHFCSRCLQSECSRSQHGNSVFERRVNTWQDRLFLNVPRMGSEDPRYKQLTGKNFISLDGSKPLEVGGWLDPRSLDQKSSETLPETLPESVELPPVEVTPVKEEASEPPSVEAPKVTEENHVSGIAQSRVLNTPEKKKQFIGTPPVKVAVSVYDPWQPKETIPGEILVKPGAKIKLKD